MTRNCFCFDLDGTICNVNHRRQYVATKPRNWDAWNNGLVKDTPNEAVSFVYQALDYFIDHNLVSTDIFIVSGRSDDYRPQTEEWLSKNGFEYTKLYMRKFGDHRDDSIVKGEIADEILKTHNIIGVFDDRKRVLDMWQAKGIWTFDVGQGCGNF